MEISFDNSNLIKASQDFSKEALDNKEISTTLNTSSSTLEDSEIYNDTLKKMEHGTDVSKGDMVRALLSFNKCSLPTFKKTNKCQIVNASILFQGTYIGKEAIEVLNRLYAFKLTWKGGFLVGNNVSLLAFKFWKYKNYNKYYTNKINSYLKKLEIETKKTYVIQAKAEFQILNGYACVPLFPMVNGLHLSGKWNFIGK